MQFDHINLRFGPTFWPIRVRAVGAAKIQAVNAAGTKESESDARWAE
jgi:hypothetical protein